ncbi:MAG: UbiA family prenyltransferase [Candidatus Altiarchaeota archaeon]|nr:UbiA family prenyltransferase [Candidatus Altiarchaeota archaeon]
MKVKKIQEHVKTFLSLIRLRNCLMTCVAVLLGASFINLGTVFSLNVLLAAAAAFMITGAGNIINDYFDYEIDRINRPHRAIPSNKIHKSDAMMLAITMFFIGLGLAKDVNDYCLAIALINSAILIIYGKYSKRMYFLSNVTISYLVASIFFYGAFANIEDLMLEQAKFQLVVIISACAFFATLSREVVKDIEDIEGDRKKYSMTLPIKLGPEKARQIASIFMATAIIISFLPLLIPAENFNPIPYGLLIAVADIIFTASMFLPPAISQKIMVLGMGLAILAFFTGEFASILF